MRSGATHNRQTAGQAIVAVDQALDAAPRDLDEHASELQSARDRRVDGPYAEEDEEELPECLFWVERGEVEERDERVEVGEVEREEEVCTRDSELVSSHSGQPNATHRRRAAGYARACRRAVEDEAGDRRGQSTVKGERVRGYPARDAPHDTRRR